MDKEAKAYKRLIRIPLSKLSEKELTKSLSDNLRDVEYAAIRIQVIQELMGNKKLDYKTRQFKDD